MPELKFSAYQHYVKDRGYLDYYPEALWEYQVNAAYKDKVLAIYPEAENIGFHGVTGISDDMNIKGQVPNYEEVAHIFTLLIRINKKLTSTIVEEELVKLEKAVTLLKDVNTEILIVYRDKNDDTKQAETYIRVDTNNKSGQKGLQNITRTDLETIFSEALSTRQ